jgi:hypothetical protein
VKGDSPGLRKRSPRGRAAVTDIAEPEGIGRTTASQQANSPECRQLVAEFVNTERDEMHAMFYRCLRVIEHASAHAENT